MTDRDLRLLVPGADPPLPLRPDPPPAAPGRRSAAALRRGDPAPQPGRRGPFPGYLLSRQAIHSAEEEEWAACAATMMGSGAVSPGCGDLPRSLCLRLARASPAADPLTPRPASRPAPAATPALPAARRAGGQQEGGPEGRPRGPRLHCGARGWGVPRSRPPQGGGWGTPRAAATCDRWLLRLREPWAAPSPRGLRSRGGAESAAGGGGGTGTDVNVYIFFIQQMPLKWLLPLCFLRNPLVSLSSCQNLLAFPAHLRCFSFRKGWREGTI